MVYSRSEARQSPLALLCIDCQETIDGEVYVNKATQDSFKALVDYCEVAQ